MNTFQPAPPVDASSGVRGLVNTIAQQFQGAKTFLAAIVASAGIQLASVFNNNGTLSTDRGVMIGFSTPDGSVNANAKQVVIGTGVGGTPVDYISFVKSGFTLHGTGQKIIQTDPVSGNHWEMRFQSNGNFEIGNNTVTYLGCRIADGYSFSQFGFETLNGPGGASVIKMWGSSNAGRIDQLGTDSSAAPGAQTSNKPIGKNAIAAGASSVVVTNSLVTAASVVLITPHARDATCKELIAVAAAGSFTVSGSANATANLPFSWRISSML